jgi:post-segregation antitoxin (ccd killing protein)
MVMDIEGLLEKFVGLSVNLGRFQSLYLDKALRSKATEKWEVEKYELERTKC